MKNLVVYLIISIISIGMATGLFLSTSQRVVTDLSEVLRRDSIIANRDSLINDLEESIEGRDSVITALVSKEVNQRGTVFFHLEDKFEEATDSAKENLIEEALISIQ